MRVLLGLLSHLLVFAAGIGLGIYALPIITQPPSPDISQIKALSHSALYSATFDKARQDSDFLHWGEGSVSITPDAIGFIGQLAPGPDYKLYLSPQYVESEASFLDLQAEMVLIGDVNTFERFYLTIPAGVHVEEYNTVIVWCETFKEFITSARYK
ncbi:DM13 domain-containing protein [Vibrio cholerae]